MSFTGRSSAFDAVEIANDGFFPAFTLGDFNAQARVDPSYNQELVAGVLTTEMTALNAELTVEKTAWLGAGYATLAAVSVQGALALYLRALFCRAKAVLLKEYSTFTRKREGENTAREGDESEGFYIQSAEKALRGLRGESGSVTCSLL